MPTSLPNRPLDATLSVTKAARLLGVHPNTVRAWSDAGRLRYYRINPRGDRRYRLGDLQRFLSAAASGGPADHGTAPAILPGSRRAERLLLQAAALHDDPPRAGFQPDALGEPRLDVAVAATLIRLPGAAPGIDRAIQEAVAVLREAIGSDLVAAWELTGS
jgi:excisionase family DNA binding protein